MVLHKGKKNHLLEWLREKKTKSDSAIMFEDTSSELKINDNSEKKETSHRKNSISTENKNNLQQIEEMYRGDLDNIIPIVTEIFDDLDNNTSLKLEIPSSNSNLCETIKIEMIHEKNCKIIKFSKSGDEKIVFI